MAARTILSLWRLTLLRSRNHISSEVNNMAGDSTYNYDHKSSLSGSAYSKKKRAELEEWTRIRDTLFYVTLNKEVPSSYACSICSDILIFIKLCAVTADCTSPIVKSLRQNVTTKCYINLKSGRYEFSLLLSYYNIINYYFMILLWCHKRVSL